MTAAFKLTGKESVADVGGTDGSCWFNDWTGPLVRCNLDFPPSPPGMRVRADARTLPFRAKAFDIAFCNSVIEHVGDSASQAQLADELRRIGRSFFLQTPNRWFPIEPHYLVPFFQFFPRRFQRWLHRRADLGWVGRNDPFEDVCLLTKKDLKRLFPEAAILPERFGPLVKSWYVVFHGSDTPRAE